ncbi:Crp/Fnr family transcriptional regulator [Pararhodobacter oceanensis]|uniref:Crp/Fnr family transcriptional regulator n=1 Tax=Pararhodobacter oceanensis TaxID=2172121 RepID=UPI003A8C995E
MSQSKPTPHPCGSCAHYAGSIWQPVTARATDALTRGFTRRNLQRGQVLFLQGDENRAVYCVSSGLIALRAHHEDGRSTLLRLAYPGDIIGYRSFLEGRSHRTEARALLPSRVCTVGQRDAQRVIGSTPAVMARLTSRCIAEIDRNHARIIASATASGQDRLADILTRLMRAHGTDTGAEFTMRLPVSRRDLADLLGVQPETISRLIKRLQEGGQMLASGRQITMPRKMLDVQAAADHAAA